MPGWTRWGKRLPLEFKILNYQPEPWTPLKSALLLKYMAWELSGFSEELMMTRTRLALGDSLTEALFFRPPLRMEPVIPAGTPWPFQPLPVPKNRRQIFSIAAECSAALRARPRQRQQQLGGGRQQDPQRLSDPVQ
ncbi:MAG: penicillin acylase family protein [Calditrichae bacterium]|nr:penicillin acylase family protein [Calditrichia bacterium]